MLAKYPFTDKTRMARGGRIVRRLHGRLARVTVTGTLPGADLARRRLRPDEHVRRDRGALVPEHEFGGTPWDEPRLATRSSRRTRYAGEFGKFKTPTLVIAGEQDYRVPYTQSLEFFTALQRQGVPSRLVLFPDEGHWISKPQNSAALVQGIPRLARPLSRA